MQLRYRYRIEPTPAQQVMLARVFGCVRVVFNDALGVRDQGYRAGVKLSDSDVERLHAKLADAVPEQSRTSIVHGGYRIDNTILDADDPTVVRAVLDWEMSTPGDPLSDAALMCVHRDPALNLILNEETAWTAPQMPSAEELAHRYAVVSGNPLVHWEFQMALGYFKLAIIAAGIDFRRRMSSERPDGDDRAGQAVAVLISRGLQTLG
jgi:aminoglycoside phosphotransferase (APT) family kinase protein